MKELQKESGISYFTYDKQGNTIKEETSSGNNCFEYNTLNQQVKAITKDGNTLVSRYDTEGLRAEIEENEKLMKFIFHKGNALVETDKDFNVISRFTRGHEVVAADIANSDEDLNSGLGFKLSRYYYTVDEQGSTSFITDKDQKIENEYYYDAFGNVLDSKEQVHNRITYTGQQFDGVTGQYYLRARFYNPVIGRFTQEDIYRGDGLNLYSYCKNNPVKYYDPSGYSSLNKERPFQSFEIPEGGVHGDNTGINLNNKNLLKNDVLEQLKNAPFSPKDASSNMPYMKKIQGEDYTLLLRRDIGQESHGLADHWNIEVQTESGNMRFDRHLFVNEDSEINKISDLSKANKKAKPNEEIIYVKGY